MATTHQYLEAVHQRYLRFSLAQRVDHWIMAISFTILAITGIPQKFAGHDWAETAIALMGGIEAVRVIHRAAATLMMLGAVYHIVGVAYRIFVLRVRLSMLPVPKDLIDMIDMVRYNLGLAVRRPLLDRYSFEEKLEYWAVIWGTLIMAITGFMLWNPITTARLLPGEFIPAAKAAHGGEAILAILSILTWHVYNAHIKHFNRSIFTGYLTREEMEHEHPIELARIESRREPVIDPEIKRRREHVFVPVATIFSLVLLTGIYFFISYEETAITTVPREQISVYAPLTPTPMRVVRRPQPTVQPGIPGSTPVPGATPMIGTSISIPSFTASVLPIFEAKCTGCHSAGQSLNLTSYAHLMKGGPSGPVIVPGNPSASLLVEKMNEVHPAKTSTEELEMIKAWIAGGAPNN